MPVLLTSTVALAFVDTPAYERFMTPEQARGVLESVNAFHPLGRHGVPRRRRRGDPLLRGRRLELDHRYHDPDRRRRARGPQRARRRRLRSCAAFHADPRRQKRRMTREIASDEYDRRSQALWDTIDEHDAEEFRAKVEELVADAQARGARTACGGNRHALGGTFFEPTVLLDVGKEDACWREEIFGPVVCIAPFDDETEMLRDVNASPYGLSGSLWTNDLRRALRVARQVESGVLSVNSHSSVHVEAPFGGFKQSGLGRDLGMAGMEGYTELKNVYVGE
jgi:hypothetical protein